MGEAVARPLFSGHVFRLCKGSNAIFDSCIFAVVNTDNWFVEKEVALFKVRIENNPVVCAICSWEARATYHRNSVR